MRAILILIAVHCALGLTCVCAAKDADGSPDQEFAAVTNALTSSRAALQHFAWDMHTVVSVKGQVRRVSDDLCRYGPDGTVYRTPLSAPPPRDETRGLRRRPVAVTDPVDDSLEVAVALSHEYVPPSPQKLEAIFQAANALFVKRADSDQTQLQFRDYQKPGDFLVLTFDPETKSLRTIDVTSYLDEQTDVLTLHVVLQSLPDGTNYVASSVLNATGRQLEVKTENANYRKLWQ
jgi:hypothetical protein